MEIGSPAFRQGILYRHPKGWTPKRSPAFRQVKSMKEFHPPHLYIGDKIYFVSIRTIEGKKLFDIPKKKQILMNCINAGIRKYNLKLYAFVVLDNHYHLLFLLTQKLLLPQLLNYINGRSSFEINKIDNSKGRKVWYQYWDRCVRSEKDFWLRFNYIHNNLVKHGYVKTMEKVKDYKFSSYNLWLKKKGQEWLDSCFENYPIKDFTVEGDE